MFGETGGALVRMSIPGKFYHVFGSLVQVLQCYWSMVSFMLSLILFKGTVVVNAIFFIFVNDS